MSGPAPERRAAFLLQVPLFQGIEPRIVQALAGVMSYQELHQGALLYEKGSIGTDCHIVAAGRLVVLAGSGTAARVLARIGVGQLLGEVALIDGGKRSATVQCDTEVNVFTLGRAEFQQLLFAGNACSQRLMESIARSLALRVRETDRYCAELMANPKQSIRKITQNLERARVTTEIDVDLTFSAEE